MMLGYFALPRAVCMLALLPAVHAAYCTGKPDPKVTPNEYPINATPPVLVRSVPNGKLFRAGAPGFEFNVMHLWGSGYDLGFAHGRLFPDNLVQTVADQVWVYMESQLDTKYLPKWFTHLVTRAGLSVALSYVAHRTRRYTPQHFFDELRGLSAATGVHYDRLLHIHLIGELTKAHCSMYGAWGPATTGGKTLGMRTLDWDFDIPAVQHPTVTVYHPDQGHPFAMVGFLAWIGALSGQSSAQMSIHEIGISYPDSSFGAESFAGVPFAFLLRDILQFDRGLNDTIARLKAAPGTCNLLLGAASGRDGSARAFQVSHSAANVMDDTNLQPLAEWHPRLNHTVYMGMDWNCPGFNAVLHDQLEAMHGVLTPESTIRTLIPTVQTGNVHAVVYDLTDQQMYVSFYKTRASTVQQPSVAYARAFTKLDLPTIFAELRPSSEVQPEFAI